jgi:hypothetical protein
MMLLMIFLFVKLSLNSETLFKHSTSSIRPYKHFLMIFFLNNIALLKLVLKNGYNEYIL